MVKTLRFGFFAAVLVMVAVAAFALSFGALAAEPKHPPSPKTAHVGIISTKAGVVFQKTTITVTHGTTLRFDNRTMAQQTVTANGQMVVTIAAKHSAPHTFATKGTYTFSLLLHPLAKLTVIVR